MKKALAIGGGILAGLLIYTIAAALRAALIAAIPNDSALEANSAIWSMFVFLIMLTPWILAIWGGIYIHKYISKREASSPQ